MKIEIVNWLKNKLNETGARGFILGLSGGIDSSVVAVLAKLATPNVLGLVLPCHSIQEDAEHANLLSKTFDIEIKKIDLSNVYDEFLKNLEDAETLIKANLKSRLRMTTLYYNGGLNNYLVLGTGNKTEISIGYFTKYGDGASDLLPIGDLYKKEVFSLAKELNINKEIINKPPSAGLWQGQTDEDEMGISYIDLDKILIALENKTSLENFNKNLIDKVKRMVTLSAHKRKLAEIYKKKKF